MKTYNLFISHSWKYGDDFQNLKDLLNNRGYFEFRDYSVPKNNPLTIYNKEHYKSELRNKITEKMKHSSVVLILSGVYSSYSETINMEIDIANELGKPIIAIEKYHAKKTSSVVTENAIETVAWNADSIVNAIRKYSI